jgi:hypothetical protein
MIGERLLTWHGSIGTPQAFDNLWHPAPNAPTPGHRRIHDWQTSRSRSIWLWGHLFFSLCIFMLYESQVVCLGWVSLRRPAVTMADRYAIVRCCFVSEPVQSLFVHGQLRRGCSPMGQRGRGHYDFLPPSKWNRFGNSSVFAHVGTCWIVAEMAGQAVHRTQRLVGISSALAIKQRF